MIVAEKASTAEPSVGRKADVFVVAETGTQAETPFPANSQTLTEAEALRSTVLENYDRRKIPATGLVSAAVRFPASPVAESVLYP